MKVVCLQPCFCFSSRLVAFPVSAVVCSSSALQRPTVSSPLTWGSFGERAQPFCGTSALLHLHILGVKWVAVGKPRACAGASGCSHAPEAVELDTSACLCLQPTPMSAPSFHQPGSAVFHVQPSLSSMQTLLLNEESDEMLGPSSAHLIQIKRQHFHSYEQLN